MMTEEDFKLIELDENGEILRGLYHLCPMCFHKLSYRPMPGTGEDYWHCPSCKTEWPTPELLQTYKELLAEGIAIESKEETDDF